MSASARNLLRGITVVSLEQAVAAPLATARLADAGARVIKIERKGTGDFARQYDKFVHGECSYFTWLNRGKESVELDLKDSKSISLVRNMLRKADIFVQNLAPGATARLGLGSEDLRHEHNHLITMDISGYGESGPMASLPAYDLLVQAESGLCVTSGTTADNPTRVGVSIVDIATGINAHGGIVQALFARERAQTGGVGLKTSLFATASELMTVPYLQQLHTGAPPVNAGLAHPSIAPYGAFPTRDAGKKVLISIQNEREWQRLCDDALGVKGLRDDSRFKTPDLRVRHRAELDQILAEIMAQHPRSVVMQRLRAANIACARVCDVADLVDHPQLQTTQCMLPVGQLARVVSPPVAVVNDSQPPGPTGVPATSSGDLLGAVPRLGEHTAAVWAEFGNEATC
eukprot:m.551868 g.551868  ORF g.551868 m.551868 type:complete len:402 (+) comp22165_c0_seq63:341-1546(+)